MPKISDQYRDERRAHILAAARRCFLRDGFHETSMQDLVREAGVSSGAVYRYFPGKDAMIVAIAEENLRDVVAIVRESARTAAGPGEAVAATLEFLSARHAEDGFAAIALLVWSEALRNPALAEHLRKSFEAAAAALTGPAEHAGALVDVLLCVLPGYLLQTAIRGPGSVAAIPSAVHTLFAGKPSTGHEN
ncbi:TetR/AcrR family transcriptional regulator [Amycolatopsis sp. OK19-0408]|uniref:TetR/AcrR family transcriptional regulator n=1 Tax=Amycolatopsis iheyensis TaxID=2945988 RepID=A0A9X2SLZ0_9PSEU|nr:TetR/AcrR family transcriptional regulator [Amycolatopsis iheyensis]MCR6485125.1 TetR/AcrR family transcriptional regulator [Amycolatopsis iheyensis]